MKINYSIPLSIDITILISFTAIYLLPKIVPTLSDQPISSIAFFIYAGFLMLLSKIACPVSRICNFFYWLPISLKPEGIMNNHVTTGIFFWIMGFVNYIGHKTDQNLKGITYDINFDKSLEFWINVAVILLLNLLVVIYVKGKNITSRPS